MPRGSDGVGSVRLSEAEEILIHGSAAGWGGCLDQKQQIRTELSLLLRNPCLRFERCP